ALHEVGLGDEVHSGMRPIARLRSLYGAGPLHLLAPIASLAFSGFVIGQVFDGLFPWIFVLWFAGAIVAHDLIAFPLYTLLDRLAQRGVKASHAGLRSVSALNHLRVPAALSGILFVMWFPLILRLSERRYLAATGKTAHAYLGRWLLATAALFACSGLVYALRLRATRGPPIQVAPISTDRR